MIKKHCGKIGFMKFIFCLTILAQHTNSKFVGERFNFVAGGAAVEFFFIVSGYLFCKKYVNYNKDEEIGETTLNFLCNRIKHFLPYLIFTFILALPFLIFTFKYTPQKFIYIIYTLLYIPVKGAHQDLIFQIFWYISAMIIAETILLPILLKYRRNFIKGVSPILTLLLMNYILIKFGNFASPWSISLIGYKGVIRAIAFINLGMFLYALHERFEKVKYTKFSKFLLYLLENLGYISILFIMNKSEAHNSYSVIMLILFSICMLISFSGKLKINDMFDNTFFYKLDALCLPLYVNQFLILCTLQKYYPKLNYGTAFFTTLGISIILGLVELWILKLYDKNANKMKRLFIEKN